MASHAQQAAYAANVRRRRTRLKGGGVPANALTLNGRPIMLNGRYITITKAA